MQFKCYLNVIQLKLHPSMQDFIEGPSKDDYLLNPGWVDPWLVLLKGMRALNFLINF